jgi:hypothetical protein
LKRKPRVAPIPLVPARPQYLPQTPPAADPRSSAPQVLKRKPRVARSLF